jgi:hypothetical protein
VRRISEADSDVVSPIGIAVSASAVLDAPLSVKDQHIVGFGSEADRGPKQLHDVRIVPLNHAGGDFPAAPTQWRGPFSP